MWGANEIMWIAIGIAAIFLIRTLIKEGPDAYAKLRKAMAGSVKDSKEIFSDIKK